MALNVVEILVRAKNETEGAFAEADASATGFSRALKATMLIGAGAVAVVGYEAVKMSINFQSAMTQLQTQAGVPKAALKGLSDGVLQLAGQVGFSPDSLAASLYHVASNMESMGGTSKQMLGVVKIAAEGAKVGGADLVDVTNALTAAVASGIPGVKNYSQAMGMLNATVGSGDMKMQDLADAFGGGMVAVVKGYGLSLKDVGAALATFGDNNIRGAHAGTMLRMSVQALAVPVAAGKKALEGMGLSMTSLATDMRSGGLMKALDDLHNHFVRAGVTAKEQGAVITEIFGKKAGAGVAVLMGQLDRLRSKYPAITKGAQDFGKAWSATNDTLKQKLDELRGKFDAVMVSVGDKLLPVLTRLANWIMGSLIPAIGRLVSWMSKHRDVVIAVAAGIATLLVPAFVAWAAAAAAAAIETIIAAAPLILIAAGVALVVYAILQLAHHWKAIWRDIKAWTMDAVDAVRHLWDRLVHDIMQWASDVIDFLKAHWPLILAILTGPVGLAVLWIVDHWHQIVTGTEHMVSDVINWFRRLPGDILHAVGNLGHLLWNAGVSILEGLLGGLKSAAGGVLSFVSGLGHDISGAFSSVLHMLSPSKVFEEHGKNIVAGLVQGIDGASGTATAAMRRLGGGLNVSGPGGYGAGGGVAGNGRIVLEFAGGSDQQILTAFAHALRVRGGSPSLIGLKTS